MYFHIVHGWPTFYDYRVPMGYNVLCSSIYIQNLKYKYYCTRHITIIWLRFYHCVRGYKSYNILCTEGIQYHWRNHLLNKSVGTCIKTIVYSIATVKYTIIWWLNACSMTGFPLIWKQLIIFNYWFINCVIVC